ncbi:FecCD family ABC transporter permease [Aquipuribacter hungaricus]|uniref:FecCD family ABC transporter permease n=1 Tax=Aquipuribacter hungaricus TaxID=545624 RepID=A0ABV7WDV9_9MICO
MTTLTSPAAAAPAPRRPAAGPPPEALALVRRSRTTGRARAVVVSTGLALACVAVFAVSLTLGDFRLPLREVLPAVVGRGGPDADFVVTTLRLPRAVTGVLVGALFGLSGAVFQSLARNPLASPDIIGITAGSTTAAVLVIVSGTTVGGTAGALLAGVPTPVAAFAGGLVSTTLVYLLAYRGGLSAYRLVLVGIGVAAVCTSLTQWLLTRAEIYDVQQATVWLTGSLNGRGWDDVRVLAVAAAVLVPAVLALARPLRALQLGDDTARGTGVPVERTRALLVLVGVGLASSATAVAGPVSFVAFLAAPLARRLVRAPLTLVPAALAGSLLVLVADLVARTAFGTTELPVGIVTGLVGAPYLLWLLTRANRVGRTG